MIHRQQRYRQRMRERGLIQVQVWARPEDSDKVRAYAKELAGVTSDSKEGSVTSDTGKGKAIDSDAAAMRWKVNKISTAKFIEILLKGLEAEGKKNMATMSPPTVAHLTAWLRRALASPADDNVTSGSQKAGGW